MTIELSIPLARWLLSLLEHLDYDDLDHESMSAEVERILADALINQEFQP